MGELACRITSYVTATSEPGDRRGEHISPESLKAALELWSQAGETHYIPLHGNSMLPLLRSGDQMLVSHNLDSVQPGDIVVFQRERNLVAHRVLVANKSGQGRDLRTKGDSWLYYDPRIPENQIFGRVLAIRRADRQMRLDTQAWRISSGLVAGVMRVQAWLYGRADLDSSHQPAGIYLYLSRGVLWLGGLLINLSQFLVGRWQPDMDAVENAL